jgi:hypothetical protein
MNKKSIMGWVIFFVLLGVANLVARYVFNWRGWIF